MLRFYRALVSHVPLANWFCRQTMSTPTKPIAVGILTPSCDITPTRETARDGAYDEFASLTQNGSEAPRDGTAPSEAPAVSVEPAYDGAEPSPSSPFTYDGDGDRAEPAGGFNSFDPFPGIPAPTKPEEVHETAAAEPETADEDAPTTRALSTLVGDDLDPYAGAEDARRRGRLLLPRRRHRFPGARARRPSCRTGARALETRAGCGKAVALDLIEPP